QGEATVNVGSIDGLEQGDELETSSGGRVKLGTIFRDRARGTISGNVRAQDEIGVPAEAHLRALVDRVEAARKRGDLEEARRRAQDAAAFFESAKPAQDAGSRLAFAENELGVALIRKSDLIGAETVLKQAAALSNDGSHARALNNLGVIAELRGDLAN